MIKIEAAQRLRITESPRYDRTHNKERVQELCERLNIRPNMLQAYDRNWSEKVERKQDLKHGNSPKPVQNTNQAMFSMQPTALAQALKRMYGTDYKAASSALSFYVNRNGKNLLSPDKDRLQKAREALRKAYGKDTPEDIKGPSMPKTNISTQPGNLKGPVMPKPMNAPSMPKPIGR